MQVALDWGRWRRVCVLRGYGLPARWGSIVARRADGGGKQVIFLYCFRQFTQYVAFGFSHDRALAQQVVAAPAAWIKR